MGKSYSIPSQQARSLSSPFDVYLESNYEHSDAVISVTIQRVSNDRVYILSASKDGLLILWQFIHDSNKQADDDDDLLKYCSELDLQTPLTKAKIVTTSEIYAATTSGHLFKVEINKDAQEVPYLQKNKVPVYETDSAIWDFVWFQPEGHD